MEGFLLGILSERILTRLSKSKNAVKETGLLVVFFRVKKAVLVPLRGFSLKEAKIGSCIGTF